MQAGISRSTVAPKPRKTRPYAPSWRTSSPMHAIGLANEPAARACMTHLTRSTGHMTSELTAPEKEAAKQSPSVLSPSAVPATKLRAPPYTKNNTPLISACPAIEMETPL